MNLRLKKGIIMAGILLCIGGMAFTSQAATDTYVISGDYRDAGVWGSANINSSAYSSGGGLVGQKIDAASGSFKLIRTDDNHELRKVNLYGAGYGILKKKLNVKTLTLPATKKIKKGLKLSVKLDGNSTKSGTIKY